MNDNTRTDSSYEKTISDEQLGAFIDGELSDEENQYLAKIIAASPELQQRIEKMRHADFAAREFFNAFDKTTYSQGATGDVGKLIGDIQKMADGESSTHDDAANVSNDNVGVENRVTPITAAKTVAASKKTTAFQKTIEFQKTREFRKTMHQRWLPMATGFIALISLLWVYRIDQTSFELSPGTVIANSHPVFSALEEFPSGVIHAVSGSASVEVVQTVYAVNQQPCREFTVVAEKASRNFACRMNYSSWSVVASVAMAGPDEYSLASDKSIETMDALIQSTTSRAPLTQEEELDLINAHWNR